MKRLYQWICQMPVMVSRRDPGSPYQAYPFDLTDPDSEVQAVLAAKLRPIKSDP